MAGTLFVLAAAAAFAFTSIILKYAYAAGLDAWQLLLWTSALALPVLAPAMRGQQVWAPPGYRILLLVHGATQFLAGVGFLIALTHLSVGLATILVFTFPAFTVLGGLLFLGRQPARVEVTALVMTLVGAACPVGPLGKAPPGMWLGVAMALLGAATHAVFLLSSERLMVRVTPMVATLWGRIASVAGALAVRPGLALDAADLSAVAWGYLALVTAFGTLLPIWLLLRGVALVGAGRAAILQASELPLAVVLGAVILSERITPLQALGGLLVAAAVWLVAAPERRYQ